MASPTTGQQTGQQNIRGLATVIEGNVRILEGVRDHLKEMNVQKEDVVRKVDECVRMCNDIAQNLKR